MKNVRNVYIKKRMRINFFFFFFFFTADKKNLQGFFDSTKGKFEHPTVKAWAEELYKEREEMLKQ